MVKIASLSVSLAFLLLSCKKGGETELSSVVQEDISVTSLSSTDEQTGEGEGTGTGTGTKEEKFTLSEVATNCHYESNTMTLLIQLKEDAKVGADNAIYFMTTIPEFGANKTVTVDQDTPNTQAAIFIRPATDPTPQLKDTPVHYTTKQSQGTFTNKRPLSSCEFKIEAAEKDAVTKGSLNCVNMAQFDEILNSDLVVLGEILALSGKWECDRYY